MTTANSAVKAAMTAEDKKMLERIYWRSFFQMAGRVGGQVRMHAVGIIFTLAPALERYCKTPEKHREALMRHSTFFNITQTVSTFCLGLVTAMEREASEDPSFDVSAITAVKTSLMGPMSAIGDSLFWGVLRLLAASICIPLAQNGLIVAPLLFLAIYNIPGMVLRRYLLFTGYTMGTTFLKEIAGSGAMKILTKGASILGLIMVGAMIASNVNFTTPLAFEFTDGSVATIQSYLDTVFLGLVPLLLSLGCLWAQRKNINTSYLTLGVFVLSILLALIGVV